MKSWKTRKTLLIVGEGYDEVAFLNHLKQFPGVCGHGVEITIRNARGKGAAGVVDCAIKLQANMAYDRVAVLLDTDTDWSAKVEKLAKKKKIEVFPSEPCLEAMLLRAIGRQPIEGKGLKKQFDAYVQNDGTRREDYAEHFGLTVLQGARHREPTIDGLLSLLGV